MPWIRLEAALVQYLLPFSHHFWNWMKKSNNLPTSRACVQKTKSLVAWIFWGPFNKRLINNNLALISQYYAFSALRASSKLGNIFARRENWLSASLLAVASPFLTLQMCNYTHLKALYLQQYKTYIHSNRDNKFALAPCI